MNRRRNLMAAALCVTLLTVLLVPLALLMSSGDSLLEGKQAAIARALEMERERKLLEKPSAVQTAVDIETIWAIEDAREETEEQLVTAMLCGTDTMGYDAESRTFYATLGMENGEEWPDIALSVYGAQAMWIDDYSYDWCAEAIAEGYRYELLAYTDTQYAYIGVVFTGLPLVTIHAEGEIIMGRDVPGRATIAAAGYAPIDTAMVTHERGGGYSPVGGKKAYRLEFHTVGDNGKDKKRDLSVLGMEADSDWLLLSNDGEETTVRNKLAWDIWRDWHEDEPALMVMDSEMVELFVDDEYRGVYQLMQRAQEEKEIERYGGDVDTDVVARFISDANPTNKPVLDLEDEMGVTIEYRYAHDGNAKRVFALLEDYEILSRTGDNRLDDEAFAALALERVDIEDMMNYLLFYHACTLQDNCRNNVFLYIMKQEDGRYVYHHAPWDLDSGFWVRNASDQSNALRWPDMSMTLPVRMLELNVGGCREILWNLWNEKRADVLSENRLHARMMKMEQDMNRSGAYRREREKWYGTDEALDLTEMAYYAEECLKLVRITMEDMWPVSGMDLMP